MLKKYFFLGLISFISFDCNCNDSAESVLRPIGRYQMIVNPQGGPTWTRLYLLDTSTGQVWVSNKTVDKSDKWVLYLDFPDE